MYETSSIGARSTQPTSFLGSFYITGQELIVLVDGLHSGRAFPLQY